MDPVVNANDYLDALGEWEDEASDADSGQDDSECGSPVDKLKKRKGSSKFKHGGARRKNAKKKLSRGKGEIRCEQPFCHSQHEN